MGFDSSFNESKRNIENNYLKKLDSLRGRLLAERQASKLANKEAELMGIKLIELEKKLKEEIEMRRKAEKKLKLLNKKLKSLKISTSLEGVDQLSSSSENCVFSCTTTSPSSATTRSSFTIESDQLKSTSITVMMSPQASP